MEEAVAASAVTLPADDAAVALQIVAYNVPSFVRLLAMINL